MKAEWIRVTSLIYWKIISISIAITTLVMILLKDVQVSNFQGELSAISDRTGLWIVLHIFIILGALNAKGDIESNELSHQILVHPSRIDWLFAKVSINAALVTLIGSMAFIIDRGLRQATGQEGVALLDYSFFVSFLLSVLLMTFLGYAISLLTKSMILSIGLLILVPILFSDLLTNVIPSIAAKLPHSLIQRLVYNHHELESEGLLLINIFIVSIWIGLAVITILFSIKRDTNL